MRKGKVLESENEINKVVNLLKCGWLKAKQVKQIHLQLLLRNPPLGSSLYLSNSMLLAYAKAAAFDACALFATQMPQFTPNISTFQFLLKAVSKLRSLTLTTQIHSTLLKLGFTGSITLINSILHCYLVSGEIRAAHQLFDEMPQPDVVSFNTMINGYAESGDMGSALQLFRRVRLPTVVTWTAMVVGFSRNHHHLMSAREFFEAMPERDLVSWNAMISGYAKSSSVEEALHLFRRMQHLHNLRPNRVTISVVLSACATLRALDTGKWMHAFINKSGFRLDPFLGSALIDMYCKCGAVELALGVFGILEDKNTCTWNALINGLAINGHVKQVLDLFAQMRAGDTSVTPDEVTFVGILLACSHGGLIEEGRNHFYSTMKEYRVPLIPEHYACIVDLLARFGMLMEAQDIIKDMQVEPDMVIWRALLAGCRLHKDVKLAEWVIDQMDSPASGDYVLLSNLYASIGRWGDLEKLRNVMKEKGIQKTPGCSSIEIDNMNHEFITGDKSHPRYVEICAKLVEVEKEMSAYGHFGRDITGLV